ncbi:MAG: CPBP family intramembrane glutamic endopeptidase [Anaerolineae bacterium]
MDARVKGVISYLLISFGVAWTIWEVAIRLGLSPRAPLFQLAALPGAFAPAVAAFVVRKWITREGFTDAGMRPNLRRWRAYLVAWLHPVAVTGIIVALAAGLGLSQPDFSLMRAGRWLTDGAEIPPPPAYIWIILPLQLLITPWLATPILWGEEFGWRGYLQRRLFPKRPTLAAVSTGVIWGLWHLPINLRGYNFPEHPALGMVLFTVGTVWLSIIFGWLHRRTGSIWAPSLAHAATNAIGGSLTLLLFMGGPNWLFVGYFGLLGWIPLGTLSAWIVLTGQLARTRPSV